MFGYRFLRSVAVALGAYGVLGLFIGAAMLSVGMTTFGQVTTLQATLENERVALVKSIRTVSATLHDTAGGTAAVQPRVDSPRGPGAQVRPVAHETGATNFHLGHPPRHAT